MKNTYGTSVSVTVYGESHGESIGAVLDGFAPGIKVDEDFIKVQMNLRRGDPRISTARKEPDIVKIMSGVFNGFTTGSPILLNIYNSDTHSSDYEKMKNTVRPGHADYSAQCKFHGFQDYRGGGHFSGRITAGITAAGSIALYALRQKNIFIGTQILKCGSIRDDDFGDNIEDMVKTLADKNFPVINDKKGEKMVDAILSAKKNLDSVGGVLRTVVTGLPSGVGEPFFDSMESMIAHAMFSIPAIKGVEFGDGFNMSDMFGSEANDSYYMRDGIVRTTTNHNGGINGGITNGMPVVFSCGVKPTPSIARVQRTVDISQLKDTDISILGRHDPAIVHKARTVVNALCAIVICDELAKRYGTDWLGNKL